MLKQDIIWPPHRRFKSKTEWEPVGFFSDSLCNSSQFDLLLGFFSSSAINILSYGFSSFLYNGGKMRLIINDILTEDDRKAIETAHSNAEIPYYNLQNIEQLKDTLSERNKHFFECLSWLIRNERIDIKIISPKDSYGISHTKCGLFYDTENYIGFDGSCNFSRTALVENIESLTVSCDWDGEIARAKIRSLKEDFEKIFSGKDENYNYLEASELTSRIVTCFENKSIEKLLEDEIKIIEDNTSSPNIPVNISEALKKAKDKVIDAIQKERASSDLPRFPFITGPKDYQKEALENWKNNKQKGLFAMATGTGKTITALNCLLEIYKKCGYYKSIILVPTIALVQQWEHECKKFNFKNIIKICSKTRDWKESVGRFRILERTQPKQSYIFICTYASFSRSSVFNELNTFSANKLLLIADEAHNMGSPQIKSRLNDIIYKRRIGLSATPSRQYDESGNSEIDAFFNCDEEYTYEYSMQKAIANGVLCQYYYYPHLVKLNTDEMDEYIDITKKYIKTLGYDDAESEQIRMNLLLKRKSIIHKADNKKIIFKQILEDYYKQKGHINYTLVYVPEGNVVDDDADIFDKYDSLPDDSNTEHLINQYTEIVKNIDRHIVVRKFTSNSKDRDDMIQDFADGTINVLTSMKCLDEGVDVPRSELAIFCASTGNPRQFIQRRGRVLRTHPDKEFAIIHDLIVIPEIAHDSSYYELEKNMVESEINRVKDFALMSRNVNDTINELERILDYYNISIFD